MPLVGEVAKYIISAGGKNLGFTLEDLTTFGGRATETQRRKRHLADGVADLVVGSRRRAVRGASAGRMPLHQRVGNDWLAFSLLVFFGAPPSKTTIEATVLVPPRCEISKHSRMRGTFLSERIAWSASTLSLPAKNVGELTFCALPSLRWHSRLPIGSRAPRVVSPSSTPVR